MKSTEGTQAAKRAAGDHAAGLVTDGETIGLGTGSTAAAAIHALGERVREGLDVTAVTSSHQSRRVAREAGVPLTDLSATPRLATTIDGADQATRAGAVIKGGGAAHAREKVIAQAADRMLVVVDDTKLTDTLDRSVPVEVLPAAEATVRRRLAELGGEPTLRAADRKDGPVVTDNGNLVFDCAFGAIDDPAGLAGRLARVPGVVEHGLFPDEADRLVVGRVRADESADGESTDDTPPTSVTVLDV